MNFTKKYNFNSIYKLLAMRVKINKILSARNAPTKIKSEPFMIGNEQYILSPHKMDEKNFTGYPLYLQLICTLPDATTDYDYVKFNVKYCTIKIRLWRKVQITERLSKEKQKGLMI